MFVFRVKSPAPDKHYASIRNLEGRAVKTCCMSAGLDDSRWLSALPQTDARKNAPALTGKNYEKEDQVNRSIQRAARSLFGRTFCGEAKGYPDITKGQQRHS
jgi:hypothetical protein